MDNQHKRTNVTARRQLQALQGRGVRQNSKISERSHMTREKNFGNTASSGKEPVNIPHIMTSLPPQYSIPIPGAVHDPALYPRTILPIPVFHSALTGYQPSITGLNQITPACLVSSNDNNNCNRERAASHSTVMEMHRMMTSPAHLRFTPYPTFLPHPYFSIHRAPNPNIGAPHITHRRNSTSTSNPQPQDAFAPPTLGPKFNPSTALPHSTSHLPYPMGVYAHHLPHLQASAQGLSLPDRIGFRRDRYSLGGPLTTNDAILHAPQNIQRRRNSIPTSLEAQQVSDESTENSSSIDDEDDDVFDSAPPTVVPHSETDAASYLEQLRESRKRALSNGVGSSQVMSACHDLPRSSTHLPRARFRRRMADVDSNASDDVNTQKRSRIIGDERTPQSSGDTPGTSSSVATVRPDDVPDPKERAQITTGSLAEGSQDTQPMPNEHSRPSRLIQPISGARTSTPSPSILKKSTTRLNRSNLTPHGGAKGQNAVGENSTPEMTRTKSLPIKKQVAFKDDVKPSQPSQPNCDVMLTSIKHDLLTKQDLTLVKGNPSAFTAKDMIGPYIFGPQLGTSPVRSITQYLVRKENTLQYYMAKVLNLGGVSADIRSGRMLLYSEHSLLTLLANHPGVVRERGFHKDVAFNPKTGQFQERLCLIVDCLTPHEFDPVTKDYLNLQQHVINVKRLTERETIRIFTSIVNVVHSLHKLNVVHRDLKLGNMVLMKKSQRILLTNFCLGRHLMSDGELLKDQRGSPAYISPDVLSGKPYAGKPSDMWSLGVVLYMMLYGQFPFYDKEPPKLFRKIKKADFVIPSHFQTSTQIDDIIRGLLTLDPAHRLTADETLTALQQCTNSWNTRRYSSQHLQVVPDVDSAKESSSDSDDERDESEQQEYEEEKLTRDFRLKLLSDDEGDDSAENRNKRFGRVSYQASLPTVQHCPYDVRPLTSEQIAMHRQLLANSTLGGRVQGST